MPLKSVRRNLLSRPAFSLAKKALPGLSETERDALDIGDVWWDGELFSGHPDWQKLLRTPSPSLSEEEQAFLEGPVNRLCSMLDEWEINRQRGDLPPEVWAYLIEQKFFAMIIPRQYGGLEFSAYANSEVVRTIASRSVVAAVTAMVPNSLGPGELLMQFGTQEQRKYWLPRLADGRELPCFALTSTTAGSDAASMLDSGHVCRDKYNGEEILGIRLNWDKRYITLSPIATVLGLAFKLYDPERLIGEEENRGITVALVPTNLPGVEVGQRHLPAQQMFQNGPTRGRNVFIPLDHIIGGEEQIGKGWKMLMSALASGRGISLPSLSAAATAFCARSTGAYSRVRRQFDLPIGKFEGVQERLAALAADAYRLDAARRLTCAGLDEGRNLSVISAIMKLHATYMMRASVDHAMDVHAGKAIIDGPRNYIGELYRATPIAITVEGANILTRSLMIFGQGAIRCHPWLLKVMQALEEPDSKIALDKFDSSFWGHVRHGLKTTFRAWVRNWSGGRIGTCPASGKNPRDYRQLSRYSAAFALLADTALISLGGSLKRKEMISARLGDILSELYFLSAVLKRWQDEDYQKEDRPLVDYCMRSGFVLIESRIAAVLDNLPLRPAAWLVRFIVQPLGKHQKGPADELTIRCAELLLSPSAARDRLTAGLYLEEGKSGCVASLEQAFDLVVQSENLRGRVRDARCQTYQEAQSKGVLTESEVALLKEADEAVNAVLAVDEYPAEDVGEKNFSINKDGT